MGARWLIPISILAVNYEVVSRWGFREPTAWLYALAPMVLVALTVVGAANVWRLDKHIRIDILYTRYSPRRKAIINVVLTTLLFFPLYVLISYKAAGYAWDAFVIHEVFMETSMRPVTWPVKTVFFAGIFWLLIQGIVVYIRNWYFIIRRKPLD